MKQFYILFLITISTTHVFCTDYYWVNNSGNWSDYNNHWATSSGGSLFHSSVPSYTDNVIFDQNSFAQLTDILVIDADASCNSFIFNNNLSPEISSVHDSVILRINGDLTLNFLFNFSYYGELIFNGNSNITSSSNSLNSRIKFDSPGGNFNLSDEFCSTDTVRFVAGNFFTQNNTCRFNFIKDDDFGTRSLYFETSDVYVTGGIKGRNNTAQEHFYADSSRFVFNNALYLYAYYKSFNIVEINSPGLIASVDNGNIDSVIINSDCQFFLHAGYTNNITLDANPADTIIIDVDGCTLGRIDGRSDSSDFVQLRYGEGQLSIDEVYSSADLEMIWYSIDVCYVDINKAMCMKNAKFTGFNYENSKRLQIQTMEIFGNGQYTSFYCDSLTLHPNTTHTFDPQAKQIFNNLFATGSASQNIILRSSIPGVQDTIEMNHDFCGNYLDISDIFVYGPNNYYAGANSINTTNNAGWNFTSCAATTDELSENKNILLYPVPASDKIYFNEPVDAIKILDITGKQVYSTRENQISSLVIGSLKGNFFMVELTNKTGVARRKLIVN
ncbi:MAG: T9SS type A sorting domain-containing protein [Bacteroidetes bacterium]|nr:T9SS type A sorting domain-containing protein [Bacteroidota bacterium]MBK9412509.1 T9SS type A sorting domain-containing protein [Bacteroidota bacterium]MBP6657263.1 T9SS type A sorting domain-containing protein [Bacteroidia bacterium]